MSTVDDPLIGFLTVVEPLEGVLIGGYLILNPKGRPVEFHCTAPVEPNRAQQILYGTSLRPYLCGDRIGQALVGQSRRKVDLLCVDVEDALGLRDHVAAPVLLLPDASPTDDIPHRNPIGNGRPPDDAPMGHVPLPLGGQTMQIHADDAADTDSIVATWQVFRNVSLNEPFGRIHEAIREAQKDAAA